MPKYAVIYDYDTFLEGDDLEKLKDAATNKFMQMLNDDWDAQPGEHDFDALISDEEGNETEFTVTLFKSRIRSDREEHFNQGDYV